MSQKETLRKLKVNNKKSNEVLYDNQPWSFDSYGVPTELQFANPVNIIRNAFVAPDFRSLGEKSLMAKQ